jgi:hypothetical protein
MLLIAHRGNYQGKEPERENTLPLLWEAIENGFNVEADVWVFNGQPYLGHDRVELVDPFELVRMSRHAWYHAKNIAALQYLRGEGFHCFAHDKDPCTLTSKGFIWTNPNQILGPLSIAVMPELWSSSIEFCHGLCSDVCVEYQASAQSFKMSF